MPRNPHQLTREQMHAIIDRGESVMLPDGRIISHKSDLPGEAEVSLMLGDEERVKAAREETKKQIADLQKRLGEMDEAEGTFAAGRQAALARTAEEEQAKPDEEQLRKAEQERLDKERLDKERQDLLAGREPEGQGQQTPHQAPAGVHGQQAEVGPGRQGGRRQQGQG